MNEHLIAATRLMVAPFLESGEIDYRKEFGLISI